MTKLAIVGAREPEISYQDFKTKLEQAISGKFDVVVSGGAVGIDSYAKQYAIENNLQFLEHLPDYSKYGRKAPVVRNMFIVQEADMMIAFPSKNSRGTHDAVRKMLREGKHVIIVQI